MSLLLLLAGCLWVSDDEVDLKEAELTDVDGDGFVDAAWGGDDCDDADADVHPDAAEVPYDGIDNDCDGTTPDDDIDGDGFDTDVDCDDDDPVIYPGAEEQCDGVDQDCDTVADNGVLLTWYADGDSDTYGDTDVVLEDCEQPSGYVAESGDCNDDDDTIKPGADELCDGVDNDCNDLIDDDDTPLDPVTWYLDDDDDGYGDRDASTTACDQPSGYVDNAGDCDDSTDAVHPGGLEQLGDFLDGDCDGDADTFTWTAIDTRDSSYVRGPTLAYTDSGSDERLHVGWSAVEFDDGSGTLYDAMLVSSLDADDPLAGEVDFVSTGSVSSIGVQGEAADFFASEDAFIWARSFDATTGRVLRLDAYDVLADSWSDVSWQQVGLGTLFDDLQVAFSRSSDVSVVGCSARGGGVEAAQLSLAELLAGDASGARYAFEPTMLYEHCDYDETLYLDYYLVTGQVDPPMETYDILAGELSLQSTWVDYDYVYTEIEFTWEFGYWSRVLPYQYEDGTPWIVFYNYWYEDSTPEASTSAAAVTTSAVIEEVDVASGPSGEVVSCGVGDDGSLTLFVTEPLSSTNVDDWPLPAPSSSALEDCSVSVTGDGVIAIALRQGDELSLGFVALP